MARYSYHCTHCNNTFEVEHSMEVKAEAPKCPKCGHTTERVFNTSGIIFKGNGFYNTDQKGK
ncbi:MAG: zinc ribbon domain-containing protein [Atopobiaceae bacterium]|nr:zinc ribbon domain-containing protein [Atopobiaceae bacterium]